MFTSKKEMSCASECIDYHIGNASSSEKLFTKTSRIEK